MKSMLEHREDRFSPTLHLVGEWSTARICDGTSMLAKGACMQPTQQKRTLTPEYIARIRAARRAAIRRRCVLVVALAALTFVVFLAGCSGIFSPVFALIPGAILAVVLYFGARASKHARAWEARIATMRAASKCKAEDELCERHNSAVIRQLKDYSSASDSDFNGEINSSDAISQNDSAEYSVSQTVVPVRNDASRDNTETSVMEQSEIRVALHRAEQERNAALRERLYKEESESKESNIVEAEKKDAYDSSNAFVASEQNYQSNQDLISFSLDSQTKSDSGNANLASRTPESLEIKSTKQVVKAVPVANVDNADDAANFAATNSSQFHEKEKVSEVDAPESSEDSLGVANLHDVLARRNA
ncbi:hypothetical protein ACLD5U_01250 [Gardnerella swidsinskii]|uniref:hypothetical protein n=1 Tax=Gardnerella swidsinskii TaxID=2792979 RepID=UPI0001D858A4|nr:hypothetical protein [Gardnerella swidsinskii]EFH71372.1 hypothetical protein GV51_0270 [Gardnerella vaginalis 5-1]RFD73502.1 hypothetical protein AXE72_05805 [Gardnerella vaginalis]RIY27056.1 hypothetical protein CJI51_01465 [Bifidobacteriaceae bacterium WP021]RIY28923.1 hypothetical protein CJI49_05070 [Bifidobacteriaceae bacterium NR016]MDK8692103.1 hypothetical protein [Gardnerella swidsinskii]